jgi:NAD(P)-dependent dehydrogenase (short-subunit alcohol dehydrogenase family)
MIRRRRAVITGGASGIGRATAARFTADGYEVMILDVDAAAIARTVAENVAAHGHAVDVSSPEAVADAFRSVDHRMDGIDVLIANAGISVRGPALAITPERWQRVLRVNLDGVFYATREAAQRMVRAGCGTILVTASTNGICGHPLYADYNASKAALISLVRTLALELAPTVRVNAVSPGYVLTPMQRTEYTDSMLADVNASLPLGRHAAPEEVADLFAFLASDRARYITGQNLVIDGGETA